MSIENKSLKKKIEELAENYERLLVEMYEAGRSSRNGVIRRRPGQEDQEGDGHPDKPRTLDLWRAGDQK